MPPFRHFLPFLLLLLTLLVACGAPPTTTPTLAPPPTVTIAAPTAQAQATATDATPPEATESSEEPVPTAAPTEAPVGPTPTAIQPDTPEPSPEAVAFAISEPAPDTEWATGSSVTVSGRAPAGAASIAVSLRAAGLELAAAQTAPDATGDWQTTLDIPDELTGTALLEVTLDDEPVEVVPVALVLPGATSGPAISLAYPHPESVTVAGHVLFFTGTVQRPPEETVTIAVLYEDCQTTASTTSFNVGEGGQWYGYIVVPETIFGPACAVAYVGAFEGAGWRAAHTPLDILEMDDPQARAVFIGNFAGSELTPGESVIVYGSAYNAPGRQVQVALQVGGENVAQGTTTADSFGYWEINLVLPPAAAGAAEGQFSATVSYDEGAESAQVPFEIEP